MRRAAFWAGMAGCGLLGLTVGGGGVAIGTARPARAQATATAAAGRFSSPVGSWRTIDDRTDKPDGIVQIYEQNGMLYGRVTGIDDPKYRAALCQHCGGYAHDRPVMGLVVLVNMKPVDAGWAGGTILNPQDGGVYHCRMHLIDGGRKLVLRGYIGTPLLGRTQTWIRLPEEEPQRFSQQGSGPAP